ncbi:MAG: AraC family transcriptional regulator, partial [Pedobacter sp.]
LLECLAIIPFYLAYDWEFKKTKTLYRRLKHLSPFIVYLLLSSFAQKFWNPLSTAMLIVKIAGVIIAICYIMAVYMDVKHKLYIATPTQRNLVGICLISIAELLMQFIMLLKYNTNVQIIFGFNILALILTTKLLLIVFVIKSLEMSRFLRAKRAEYTDPLNADNLPINNGLVNYKSSSLQEESLINLAERIEKCLLEDKVFLQSDISLNTFSEHCKIQKHHISQVLNVYMKKSFYRLIAEHRINYVHQRLLEDKVIKIESIAYDAGFNSTSSFYKHFKEITGTTPINYLALMGNRPEHDKSDRLI